MRERPQHYSLMKFPRNLISFAHAALSRCNFTSQREFRVQIKMFIALSGVRTVACEQPSIFISLSRTRPAPLTSILLFYEPDGTPV